MSLLRPPPPLLRCERAARSNFSNSFSRFSASWQEVATPANQCIGLCNFLSLKLPVVWRLPELWCSRRFLSRRSKRLPTVRWERNSRGEWRRRRRFMRTTLQNWRFSPTRLERRGSLFPQIFFAVITWFLLNSAELNIDLSHPTSTSSEITNFR